jgi:thioredoxin reductase
VFGNVMVGPTADDVRDKRNKGTTPEGLARLRRDAARLVPALADIEITATYAGLRAATGSSDYVLGRNERIVTLGGIRSTGLTASMALAEWAHVALTQAGAEPSGPTVVFTAMPSMPQLGERFERPYESGGRIVCHCERVTAGEIADAFNDVLPPVDIDGLRRRTRAMSGRCQGFYCAAELDECFTDTGLAGTPVPSTQVPGTQVGGTQVGGTPVTVKAPVRRESVDVMVIGGGPSGLAAAVEARSRSLGRVLVIEREADAGGIPRHSNHIGYGVRDLHRLLTGPRYAREWVARAEAAGVEVWTSASATSWTGERSVMVTREHGVVEVDARTVILATGCRERPRSARAIAGDRAVGVMTTGALQQRVHLHHRHVGKRAVVVGTEHVSASAVQTLRDAGCHVVAMVTDQPRLQTSRVLMAAMARGVDVRYGVSVRQIHGASRVESVELSDGSTLACDTVILTGDWVADSELAQRGDIGIESSAKSVMVDEHGRTEREGVFAVGNVTHPAETADACVRDGQRVIDSVDEWLRTDHWPRAKSADVMAELPIIWVSPRHLSVNPNVDSSIRNERMVFRVNRDVGRALPHVEVRQGESVLWTGRARGVPRVGRSLSIRSDWMSTVTSDETITIRLVT